LYASSRADEQSEQATRLYIRVLWFLMPVAWITRQVLSAQHYLDSDGIAYADIAYQCVRGNWRALVNGYWSPGYPALVSLWLSALRPSPYREIMVIRVFNCLALVGALYSFRFFLNTMLNRSNVTSISENGATTLPLWVLRAVGCTLFFWTTVVLFPTYVDAPDIFVLAALLLAAGISIQIVDGKRGWLRYASLGAVLGVGYLMKAAVLPLSPVFLATTFLGTYRRAHAVRRLLLSVIVLGVVSAPFIYALSKDKERITFGDSGAINYAIAVNYIDTTVYWQGETAGSGIPKHPVRKLLDVPQVYEYAHPISASYPPWYDHSYWYDGVRPHLLWKRQLNVIHIGLHAYYGIIFEQLGALVAGYLVLLFAGGSLQSYAKRLLKAFPVWGPAVAGLGMYALVHVEPRFLNGFIVLGWAACFLSLRLKPSEAAPVVIRSIAFAVVVGLGIQILVSVGHSASQFANSRDYLDWRVSQQLHSMGVQPGDRVSFIGDALNNHVWAHLARVSIVSEVPLRGESSFWAATPELRSQVFNLFVHSGAKAVVAMEIPPELVPDGWERVMGTDYYILKLIQRQ